jgi:WhiB family redox-sensing transcriptional regulator
MSSDPFTQFALTLPNFPEAQCAKSSFEPDTWFPEGLRNVGIREQDTFIARAICNGCIHQVDCLQFALDNGIGDGIWGGLLPEERRATDGNQSKSAIRQAKLDSVRQAMAMGMDIERACLDVGISTKTYDRYLHFERAGWPPQISKTKKDRAQVKDKK